MEKYDVAIIGGGAAGMMAAIWASKNKSVILIEKNNEIGRKVFITGNGRCNLTNKNVEAKYYYGSNEKFISSVLKTFDQAETIKFFESLGLDVKEEDNGRIFPMSDQSQSVIDVLEKELNKGNVKIVYNSPVSGVKYKNDWEIFVSDAIRYTADKLIITTGGKSAYQTGSSGDGYDWVKVLGHRIIPLYPALTALETKETWVKDIKGIKTMCNVKVVADSKNICQKKGDIIFTHFGISGPAIMYQARFITPLVDKDVSIVLDLFCDKSETQLDEMFKKIIDKNGAKGIKNCLAYLVPLKLAIVILQNIGIRDTKKAAEISKSDRKEIVSELKKLTLTPKRLRSFAKSQVTRGGIDTQEIDPKTMRSKIVSDLYFAGEVVDVDGDSGGFNLQWAWSSGYIAGISV